MDWISIGFLYIVIGLVLTFLLMRVSNLSSVLLSYDATKIGLSFFFWPFVWAYIIISFVIRMAGWVLIEINKEIFKK